MTTWAQRPRRERIAAKNRNQIGLCPITGKQMFASKRQARRAWRARHPGDHLNEFTCDGDNGCGYWHYGHLPEDVRRGERPRSQLTKGA